MGKELRELAQAVADEHRLHGQAVDAERSAMARLLRLVVEDVAPALPAVCSRLVLVDGPPRRAVVVAHRGPLALCLGQDGGFFEVEDGAARDALSVEQVAARRWDAGAVFQALADALAAQVGGKKDRQIDEMLERAARLEALALLYGGRK